MTLETRTVALTAEQWQFLGMAVEEQARSAEVSALNCGEVQEAGAASLFREEIDFWNTILTSIRSAGA